MKENKMTKWEREAEGKPLYSVWHNIKARCYGWGKCDSQKYQRERYHERGISFDPKWIDYAAFERDILPIYQKAREQYGNKVELLIDRIDVDGDYVKKNIRFVSRFESNTVGKSNLVHITHMGITMPIAWWSRVYGIEQRTIQTRIKAGWSVERALNQETQKRS